MKNQNPGQLFLIRKKHIAQFVPQAEKPIDSGAIFSGPGNRVIPSHK